MSKGNGIAAKAPIENAIAPLTMVTAEDFHERLRLMDNAMCVLYVVVDRLATEQAESKTEEGAMLYSASMTAFASARERMDEVKAGARLLTG